MIELMMVNEFVTSFAVGAQIFKILKILIQDTHASYEPWHEFYFFYGALMEQCRVLGKKIV